MTPMETGVRRHEGASALLASLASLPDDRVRQIINLETIEDRRRKGDASKLLKMLCEEADISATVLVLEPRPYLEGPLDDDALMLWYRRYGFRVIQTAPITLMSRAPRFVQSTRH